jgi:hypothetical protein
LAAGDVPKMNGNINRSTKIQHTASKVCWISFVTPQAWGKSNILKKFYIDICRKLSLEDF